MFAYWNQPRTGEPWEPLHDADLRTDYKQGCAPWIIARRARRTEDEVLARLEDLGLSIEDQPKGIKIRSTTWTRHR